MLNNKVGDMELAHKFPDDKKNLTFLTQELGEVIQAITKIELYGMLNVNPLLPGSLNNIQRLHSEIGDVLAVIDIMIANNYLYSSLLEKATGDKLKRMEKWYNVPKQD